MRVMEANDPEVVGSNPAPATIFSPSPSGEGLFSSWLTVRGRRSATSTLKNSATAKRSVTLQPTWPSELLWVCFELEFCFYYFLRPVLVPKF